MLGQSRKDLICLFVAIILVTASMIYWSAFSIKLYHTFHLSWDVANSAYDMYYHIHHLSQLHGLQYLSFADHLAPDQLIILPVFYLFPSALTLLLVQVAVVSLTGLLVFFITKRLTKSSFFGLLLCFAFLINPGTTGIIISDYHAEFLIIPFMLLTFYFFTERKRLPFFASLLLLLGTIESASFLGLALGAGLLFFEFRYDTNEKRGMRKEKIKLAISIILLSLLAIAAYAYSGASLSSSYANGSYSGLPPTLHVINFAAKESTELFSIGAGAGLQGFIPPAYVLYALAVVFLGFGISALFVPEVALLFALPWLVESLIFGKINFLLVGYQYFSYTLGGAIISVFLAVWAIKAGSARFQTVSKYLFGKDQMYTVRRSIFFSCLVLLLLYPLFLVSSLVANPIPLFLLHTPPAQAKQAAQLSSMILAIPSNSTVVAPLGALSHLAERAELFPTMGPAIGANELWFSPQYVLVESNQSVASSLRFNINETSLDNTILSSGNYSLYAENGSAELYGLLGNYS